MTLHFKIKWYLYKYILQHVSDFKQTPKKKKLPALNICAFEGSQFMTWGFLWKVWVSERPAPLHQDPLPFKILRINGLKSRTGNLFFLNTWLWWHNGCSRWKVLSRNGGRSFPSVFSLSCSARQPLWLSPKFLTFYYTNQNRRCQPRQTKTTRSRAW